ncbi:hypothetical protein F4810DRAFT_710676 [Camillea tinctor]|nr:hypothetical protein F4810DRAFT_710676 [Camillea tinctor]
MSRKRSKKQQGGGGAGENGKKPKETKPKETKPKETKSKAANPKGTTPKQTKPKEKKSNEKPKKIVRDWNSYFGSGELADWQRLMSDLGFQGEEFLSKSQCRKALQGVWVNIQDFLDATESGEPVHRFESEAELSAYTMSCKKIFPKKDITKGSPLAKLLAHILYPHLESGGKRRR